MLHLGGCTPSAAVCLCSVPVCCTRMPDWTPAVRTAKTEVVVRERRSVAVVTTPTGPVPLFSENVTLPQVFFLRRFRTLVPNSDPATASDSLDVQLLPRKPASGFQISLVEVAGAAAASAGDVERLKQVCPPPPRLYGCCCWPSEVVVTAVNYFSSLCSLASTCDCGPSFLLCFSDPCPCFAGHPQPEGFPGRDARLRHPWSVGACSMDPLPHLPAENVFLVPRSSWA